MGQLKLPKWAKARGPNGRRHVKVGDMVARTSHADIMTDKARWMTARAGKGWRPWRTARTGRG